MRKRHKVQYFGMEHEGRIVGNHAEQYTDNMDFHTGKLKKLLYPFKIIYSKEAAKKITRVLDDFKPDVVHLNNFNFQLTPSVIYAARRWERKSGNKVKIIYTAHDYQWVCPNHMMYIPTDNSLCFQCKSGKFSNCAKNKCIHNSKLKSILGAFEGALYYRLKTYGMVDTIICPSEFMADKLKTYPDIMDKIKVIHNFAENKTVSKALPQRSYVLYFGRYTKEKGVDTLIKACKALPEINFRFAGTGELSDEIDRCNNAENSGFLSGEKLEDCLKGARFVVFPSEWYENCPFSVMEALSLGIPVLASDIGGVPELVFDGINGELFEAGNVDELKSRLSDLWNNDEKISKYSDGARNTKFLSLKEYVDELLCVY